MKLSETQIRAVEAIRAHGGKAVSAGGGYWKGTDGEVLRGVPTTTIYALESRRILDRERIAREPWKDTYTLNNVFAPLPQGRS